MDTATSNRQRTSRDMLFLKGPIKFGWIRRNIPDPTSRLIMVAEAFMQMARPDAAQLELTAKVWNCAGIEGHDRRARILKTIDASVENYRVERRPGRTSVLHRV